MAKSPAASLNIHLTPKTNIDIPAVVRCEIEGQACIYTCVALVNYIRTSNVTDDVIAKPTLEIGSSQKFLNPTAVQIAEALRHMALQCGDVFSKQRTKSRFVEG